MSSCVATVNCLFKGEIAVSFAMMKTNYHQLLKHMHTMHTFKHFFLWFDECSLFLTSFSKYLKLGHFLMSYLYFHGFSCFLQLCLLDNTPPLFAVCAAVFDELYQSHTLCWWAASERHHPLSPHPLVLAKAFYNRSTNTKTLRKPQRSEHSGVHRRALLSREPLMTLQINQFSASSSGSVLRK